MDVGVIGVGRMGKNHVRVYSELKGVDSVGIFDPDTAGAQETGVKHGAAVYSSLAELLANCDAVSVCVPTPFHKNVVDQVFSACKSVLIEKPICSTVYEAAELMLTDQKDREKTALCRDEAAQSRISTGHREHSDRRSDDPRYRYPA
jgi:predicted dehydrogenase